MGRLSTSPSATRRHGIARRLRSSAWLLLILGVMFSVPVVAKTWSAHGALPAIATGGLVVVAVFLGPLAFLAAAPVDTAFLGAAALTTPIEAILLLSTGIALVIAWANARSNPTVRAGWYLPVTGWALLGAWFCISIVFAHAT
ncbi:MAG: hypothetical protein R3228_15255 [Halioglobus sp.]|nr:hypothetical protein [Halioglobus sp.]